MLVVQALRPDRLQSAMSLFASKALGESNGVDPCNSLLCETKTLLLSFLSFDHEVCTLREDDVIDDDDDDSSINDDYDYGMMIKNHDV